MQATISILLPVYNAETTLHECLDSIKNQTHKNFEVIVVNDGSTDSSLKILTKYAKDDVRFKIYTREKCGLVDALNFGLDRCGSEYIARMDADDIMLPQRLELQLQHLQKHPEITLVSTQVKKFPESYINKGYQEYINWQNSCLKPKQIKQNIYIESPHAHPSIMFRKTTIQEIGGYKLGTFPEDYELWLRLDSYGYLMEKIPEVLLWWRDSEKRTSRCDPRYSKNSFDRLRTEYLLKNPLLYQNKEIFFWGAGRKTRRKAELLILNGIMPSAWIDVDKNKVGNTHHDAPVVSPEYILGRNNILILSFVSNHGAREKIKQYLLRSGLTINEDFILAS